MSQPKPKRNKPIASPHKNFFFLSFGSTLITVGLGILLFTFYPVVREEIRFQLRTSDPSTFAQDASITPKDSEFGIVIPKIGANASVVLNVDPFNASIYQKTLTRGVAHAKGSAIPSDFGNVFLFSHSSVNFYEAIRFNSVFYLLDKLEFGDTIDLYFRGEKYSYRVTTKQRVNPTEVSYLDNSVSVDYQLTLMTCWPPGTTYKRLIVLASRLQNPTKFD